ncbi:YbaB/EbfC family nucleoid-associated protein [Nocardia sp. NPDC006630]|uniref:YbaB/EbfC family nucleoid-associated protein n=1 Tax=Nocardia sp. NPDC006630 TaxID=3157181 RepID=UPI00339EA5D8
MISSNADIALTELMLHAAHIGQQVTRIRGQGAAAQGQVRAEVDADGTLTGLSIDDALQGTAMRELARLVVEAQQAACAQAGASAAALRRTFTDNPYAASLLHQSAAAGMRAAQSKPPRAQRPYATESYDEPLPPGTVGPSDWRDDWDLPQRAW